MFQINNAVLLRRDLKVRIADILLNKKDLSELNKLPVMMTPKGSKNNIRCCSYKERAVTRSAALAIFGVDFKEDDELRSIEEYAEEKLVSGEVSPDVLTVLNEGCSACTKNSYFVTNACKGCVARPCMMNCPVKAITIEHGRAVIDPDKCINCGKCVAVCPYHAITYIPVPCQEVCPVDAITKDEDGIAIIDFEKCIMCGKCILACPFGAIFEKSQMPLVISKINQKKRVDAMVAPAIAGQFMVEYGKIISGLLAVGFSEVAEVAYGAVITGQHETAEWCELYEENEKPRLTSSCCPAYVSYVEKHIPDKKEFVSSTFSPMRYTSEEIKRKDPNAITVFIGPCIAKKAEALSDHNTDYVLSFEEIGAMLAAKDVQLMELVESKPSLVGDGPARNFAVTQGVAEAIRLNVPASCNFNPEVINGIDKKSMHKISAFLDGKLKTNFMEVMACEGGCIAGPNSITNPKIGAAFLKKSL